MKSRISPELHQAIWHNLQLISETSAKERLTQNLKPAKAKSPEETFTKLLDNEDIEGINRLLEGGFVVKEKHLRQALVGDISITTTEQVFLALLAKLELPPSTTARQAVANRLYAAIRTSATMTTVVKKPRA